MFEIPLDDIDKLHQILLDLGVITYLTDLVLYDIDNNSICKPNIICYRENTIPFLLCRQEETVAKLRTLLNKISLGGLIETEEF